MLNVFVIGFGLLCMFSTLCYLTGWSFLWVLILNTFVLTAYAFWCYILNNLITSRAYASGKKLSGEVIGRQIIYGRKYYMVSAADCEFLIRASKVRLDIGDKADIWVLGCVSFLDKDGSCILCDGVVAFGLRMICAISWIASGICVSWVCYIPAVLILLSQFYFSDLQLSIKGKTETGEVRVKNTVVVKGHLFLDTDKGVRVKPLYKLAEFYPTGAGIMSFGSYADIFTLHID